MMKKTPSPSLLAPFALALGLAACGGAPAEDATAEAPRVTPAEAEKERRGRAVEKTFAAWSFESCDDEPCDAGFARAAGGDVASPTGWSPRSVLEKNPDKEWLPEWERLPASAPGAAYAWRALTLAAVNRTYAARCDEAYAAYAKELTKVLKGLDHGIAKANREPNPYDRLGQLLSMEPHKPPPAGQAGEFVPGSDAARFAWEASVFEAFESTNRTFLYIATGHAPTEELLSSMRPRQDRDYERDAFCLDAMAGKIPGVPAMPELGAQFADVRGMVRGVVAQERVPIVEKRREELTGVVRARFQKARVSTPGLPPGVRVITLAKVQKFERDGRGATVQVVATQETARVEPDGTRKRVVIDETATATFPDWPSGLTLEPGETITFFGAERTEKITIIQSTKDLEHKSRQTTIDGKHVWKAARKNGSTMWFREG